MRTAAGKNPAAVSFLNNEGTKKQSDAGGSPSPGAAMLAGRMAWLLACAGNALLLRPGRAHSVQNHRSSRSSFQRGAKVFLYYFVTLLFNFLVKLTA
jgi:hypothetical protein